jgi:hypothetical protein
VLRAAVQAPPFLQAGEAARLCSMEQPANKPVTLHDLFPQLSESQVQEVERYFELALEIAEQEPAAAEHPVDNSLSMSTMKERSNSNLKD